MSRTSENNCSFKSKIGGQALIEGIMMRGIDLSAMACRLPDGTIDVETWSIRNGKDAPLYLKVPFIRGCFNFAISLKDGLKCTMKSAEKQMTDDDSDEDEEMSAFEKWLSNTKLWKNLEAKLEGEKGKEYMTAFSIGLSIIMMVICVCILKFLPAFFSGLLGDACAPWIKAVVEGVIKLSLIIGYFWLISNMKDIHTTFMYHGAEHKTIACYENGLELTVENVRKQSRFHPRCGTSFIFLVMLLSIAIGMFLPWDNVWERFGLQLIMLIPEASVGYELIKLAGRCDNILTRIISAPGLWLQRITTKEPNDKQIEVAIAALTPCIPKDKNEDRW
ncbi:MAG: DUF1385 domain-containing protein [Huintestinicola sp.]